MSAKEQIDGQPSAVPSQESGPSRGRLRAGLVFIFITVVLDMLALGIISPVLPRLIIDLLHGSTTQAAEIIGIFGTMVAFLQFVFSPILGAVSDHFGRRPVILLSNFGLGIDYMIMAVAPGVGWLFAGRTLSGVMSASMGAASAYIADVTPGEKRAAAFGLLNVAFGVGFVLGPALGGMLGQIDTRLPFWFAAGLSLTNAMYGLFVLPESLSRNVRKKFAWRRANPLGAMLFLKSDSKLFRLAIVQFLCNIAHQALPTVFVIYAMYRYNWNARTVGLVLASMGLCSALTSGLLVKPAVAFMGERRVLIGSLAAGVAGFLVFGFASTGVIFCTAIPLQALWSLAWPSMQSLITRRVQRSEQGQLQGAIGSMRGIAYMIGPSLFTMTFATFIAMPGKWHLTGAPFLVGALLAGVSLVLAVMAGKFAPVAEKGGVGAASAD